tara:strand:+ start:515 stop:2284 length:1770 start_codon:yes stop_codon:yes gene_type:complete
MKKLFFSIFFISLLPQALISEEKKNNVNSINWKILNKNYENEPIKWEIINEKFTSETDYIQEKSRKFSLREKINLSKPKKKVGLFSGPFIFSNSFLRKGYISHDLKQKSAFSGGDAQGSGNQNYSYGINYGLSDEETISGIISEADDPLYNKILNKSKRKNSWRNYALVYNRKLLSTKNDLNLSFNISLEYWNINSYFKKKDNNIVYGADHKILGSLAIPLSKKYNNLNFTLSPRISFIPDEFGFSSKDKNFYGNNYSLSAGLELDIFDNTSIEATYTTLYGDSKNTFDNELNFSKNNIYSYGINWNPNSIVDFNLGVTNAFGLTPATSLLTLPSANIPLYQFHMTIRPDYRDTIKSSIIYEKKYLYQSGLTVNNALIPRRESSELWLSYDGAKSLYGFYGYSISNVFQIEFANLASIENIKISDNKANNKLRDTFFTEGNFNNRFGGTLNLLSPDKGDLFWMSLRTTLGRDQKSDQGYLFSEILNTFQLSDRLTLNISPKYAWSGIQSTGGAGLSFIYAINEKISFSPEINFNFRNHKEINNSFVLKYLINENKSLDLYVSNALGIQDMSQLIRSKEHKIGIRLNLII